MKINTSLTELNLSGDEKKIQLSEMKEMKNEQWIGNEVGTEGAKSLSESLKNNTSLTELNVSGDEKKVKWSEMNEMKEMKNE